jgi:hypothetical protein
MTEEYEIEKLRNEKEKLERDLKASIFDNKTANPVVSTNSLSLLEGIDRDRAIFLYDEQKKTVDKMSDEDLFVLRSNMLAAQTEHRIRLHAVSAEIIEREEKANDEEKKALKELDKKYKPKKTEEKKTNGNGVNPFEKLVKALVGMGIPEAEARNQAANTIILNNMKEKK